MTLVKICGISDLGTAMSAAGNTADMIGLVFYPKSPRHVTSEKASKIVKAVHELKESVQAIGLTVNMPTDEIVTLVREVELDGVQLSGDETPQQVAAVAQALPDMKLLKSLRLLPNQNARDALRLVAKYYELVPNVTILLDSYREGKYGGTGDVGDWTRAREVAEKYPIILAGGLTPDNVADAIRQVQPFGVDVSSGVESAPGIKEAHLIYQFLSAARTTYITVDPLELPFSLLPLLEILKSWGSPLEYTLYKPRILTNNVTLEQVELWSHASLTLKFGPRAGRDSLGRRILVEDFFRSR